MQEERNKINSKTKHGTLRQENEGGNNGLSHNHSLPVQELHMMVTLSNVLFFTECISNHLY